MRDADVLIQAGHEGRRTGATGATGASGPLGNEIDWTPIVADEATAVLRAAGVSVVREKAEFSGRYNVLIALFIHFDGADRPCTTGASIGYNDNSDKPAADDWKQLYSRYWSFKWMPDNFTRNLSRYYGFGFANTVDAELVLELGEISCMEQAQWLKPRLKWLGKLIAHFVSRRINKGDVPDPGPFQG